MLDVMPLRPLYIEKLCSWRRVLALEIPENNSNSKYHIIITVSSYNY